MIEKHYASVIENWDGRQVPAERQIRAARRTTGRAMDVAANSEHAAPTRKVPGNPQKSPPGDSNPQPLHYKF